MNRLQTEPGFRAAQVTGAPLHAGQTAGDAFYAMLIDAHRELSDAQSELLNARLLLLLANQVGDLALLQQALELARRGVKPALGSGATEKPGGPAACASDAPHFGVSQPPA